MDSPRLLSAHKHCRASGDKAEWRRLGRGVALWPFLCSACSYKDKQHAVRLGCLSATLVRPLAPTPLPGCC